MHCEISRLSCCRSTDNFRSTIALEMTFIFIQISHILCHIIAIHFQSYSISVQAVDILLLKAEMKQGIYRKQQNVLQHCHFTKLLVFLFLCRTVHGHCSYAHALSSVNKRFNTIIFRFAAETTNLFYAFAITIFHSAHVNHDIAKYQEMIYSLFRKFFPIFFFVHNVARI